MAMFLDSLCKNPTHSKFVSSRLHIADAILREPEAVQPVACSNGNNLEMEKDWELMSELD